MATHLKTSYSSVMCISQLTCAVFFNTEVNNHYALCCSWFLTKGFFQNSRLRHTASEWIGKEHELRWMWFHLICRKQLRVIRLRAKLSQTFLKRDWPKLRTCAVLVLTQPFNFSRLDVTPLIDLEAKSLHSHCCCCIIPFTLSSLTQTPWALLYSVMAHLLKKHL